MLSIKNLIT